MRRSYDFYEKRYNWNNQMVDQLLFILDSVNNDVIDEEAIRNNGEQLLRLCVCEDKLDLFKKLISPFPFKTGEVDVNPTTRIRRDKIRYHYLIDFFTLESHGFFDEFPRSIMEAYVRNQVSAKYGLSEEKTIEEISKDIVILSEYNRQSIMNVALDIDLNAMKSMRIKDVLARQISGLGHPINNKDDVKYYSETPTVIPSMMLYDLNIQTVSNDTDGCYNDNSNDSDIVSVNIGIDYDSLSEENKFVFKLMCLKGQASVGENPNGSKFYHIFCKTIPDQEVSLVSSELVQTVEHFFPQDYIFGMVERESIIEKLRPIYADQPEAFNEFALSATNDELVKYNNEIFAESLICDDNGIYISESAKERHYKFLNIKKLIK